MAPFTQLTLAGVPGFARAAITDKPTFGIVAQFARLPEFDTWRPGYAGAKVDVLKAGTTDLAPLFYDVSLSQRAPNPQVLLVLTDENGATYGKWAEPLYTYVPYLLLIEDTSSTGITNPPITSLPGLDASLMVASSTRGRYPLSIGQWLDRDVYATLYGALSEAAGSAVCTATLQAAIGSAAAQGGGFVVVPEGNIPFTRLVVPQGVVLRGKGIGATTLRSFETQAVITLGGDGCGLADMTLDGVNVIGGSVGVLGVDIASSVFDRVLIQRFDTGLLMKGAAGAVWRDLSVSGCNKGADLRGDADLGNTSAGSEIANLRWEGGRVSLNTIAGVFFDFFDQPVRDVTLAGVGFIGNSDTAVKINGARGLRFEGCYWTANSVNLLVQDDANQALIDINTVQSLTFVGGSMNGGTLTFNGGCEDILVDGMTMVGVNYDLTIPQQPILLIGCIEDASTTATGDTTKLLRSSQHDRGTVAGVTTDGTAITAWSHLMPAGAVDLLVVKAVARRRNGPEYGIFFIQTGVARPGAGLPVSLVTTAFTAGKIVIGQTSGASARITTVDVTAGSGTLTVRDIRGTFTSGELLVDASNGQGRVNGQLVYANAALDALGAGELRAAQVTGAAGYAITFDVLGGQVRVRLTGAAGHIVEWTVEITLFEP